jgi:hypothetical protein
LDEDARCDFVRRAACIDDANAIGFLFRYPSESITDSLVKRIAAATDTVWRISVALSGAFSGFVER